jgi:hypothetical protein
VYELARALLHTHVHSFAKPAYHTAKVTGVIVQRRLLVKQYRAVDTGKHASKECGDHTKRPRPQDQASSPTHQRRRATKRCDTFSSDENSDNVCKICTRHTNETLIILIPPCNAFQENFAEDPVKDDNIYCRKQPIAVYDIEVLRTESFINDKIVNFILALTFERYESDLKVCYNCVCDTTTALLH